MYTPTFYAEQNKLLLIYTEQVVQKRRFGLGLRGSHGCIFTGLQTYQTFRGFLSYLKSIIILPWRNSPQWAKASSLPRNHDHTYRHHTW